LPVTERKNREEFGKGRFLMTVEKWLQTRDKEEMGDSLRKKRINISNLLPKTKR